MKKALLVTLIALSAIVSFAQNQYEAPINPAFINMIQSGQKGPFYGYLPPVNDLSNKQYASATKGPLVLPATYDLRTLGYVTSVKNQLSCGACWTFATCASTESYWIIQGEGSYDLSEDNINNCHDFDWTPCNGGNIMISAAYLSRGSGVMSESSDPYTGYSGSCPTTISPLKYVSEVRYLSNITNNIKQAIYDYGALYTSYFHDDAYYSTSSNSYYYSGTEYANHAVTLVGWDDNKVTSGGTGAWIVKNSWGTSWGNSGYFYISYNDARVNSEVGYFPGFRNFTTGDNVMTYAKFGEINDIGMGGTTGYGLIKYTAPNNMIVKAIGSFIASGSSSTVSVEIYDDFDGTNLSNLIDTIGVKTFALPGYSTMELSTPIAVLSGNDIYIKVRYSTPGYSYPIPVEEVYTDYASNVTLETGKCWVSSNGTTWNAAGSGTTREYDLCINLYTSAVTGSVNTTFVASETSTCTGEIVFTDQSTNSPTNWLWTFGDGQTSTLQNPTHYYTTNGTYTVKLVSWNIFSTDSLVRSAYVSVALPAAPSTTGATICSGQTATVSATGSGSIEWYSQPYGGTMLGTGSSFTTPVLNSSTSFYAMSVNSTSVSGAKPDSVGGGAFTSGASNYLIFDAYAPFTLSSIKVYASTAGNRTIELRNSSGSSLATFVYNCSVGVNTIPVNFSVPAGTSLQLGLQSSSTAYLYRNSSGVSYPYTAPGYFSVTNSSYGTSRYYYFYDWQINETCSSARTEANVVVSGPNDQLNVSSPQTLCEGESITLTASAADTYQWFPGGQTTQSITVSQAGSYYAMVTGSSCSVYTDTVSVSFTALPTAGFTYNINGNIVQFTTTSTNATSYLWEFGDGTTAAQANPAHYFSTAGSYTVNHYARNECDTVLATEVISITTGITETENHFRLWPNPADDVLQISFDSDIPAYVRIISLQGQEIGKWFPKEKEISLQLSGLSSGVYIIECTGEKVERMRFVVK